MSHTHLILPSNTSDFSTNATNSFRVSLPYAQSFEGEWELALTEVTYPVSWNTVKVGEGKIHITYGHHGLRVPLIIQVHPGFYNDIHELLRAINFALESENEKITDKLFLADFAMLKLARLKQLDYDAFKEWKKLGYNYYEIFNNPDLITDVDGTATGIEKYQRNFDESEANVKKPKRKLLTKGLKIDFNSDIKRVRISINDKTIKRIAFDESLRFMLGFKETKEVKPTIVADYNPDVSGGLVNFFIYCSLVEPQCIGNSLQQLLRTVPLTENILGNVVHKEFITPHYVGLLTKNFDTVEVEIRDDHGQLIDFQFGTVVLKIHFRKKSILNR